MNIENVTVFTDASFCPETKCAGGAFWARGDAERMNSSFPITGAAQAHEAEIVAACMAIIQMSEDPAFGQLLRLGRQTRLVLVIDCLAIRDAFEARIRPSTPIIDQHIARVEALRKEHGFLLKINHVKAHKGKATPRQWVNNWCDKEAKRQMREQRGLRSLGVEACL
ncbi:hypothetical protein NJI34_00155 [Pseudomonas sp. S 311-6]|uniref:RNase H family protein n=1 Tax=Pseudomonas TaxID=286 RepID=UPI002097A7A9|nr:MULTISPECIES: RNase H family protein [Pseudomonas]MCO7567803.1 hypothetical protein [Pseudomonas mosselii]MCO7619350.1 hypothetical protein [Pseudomonas guariconensis]MCO7635194.1 hypothetical protein [Pseudomonas sp. S 311-6]